MGCTNPQTMTRSTWEGMPPDHPGLHMHPRSGVMQVGLTVPCGKCVSCASAKASQWAVRAYHEASLHSQNSFLTLTYKDEHLPDDGRVSLVHLQDFWRELRRRYAPTKLRYLACGEYGELTRRPHYHAIIFGADFREGSVPLLMDGYTNPVVEEIWGHGIISIQDVTMASCCYVAGYATKKLNDPDTFVRMSTRPGLGHDWLDKYEDEIRRLGGVVIDGRLYPVPKRYMDWLDFDDIKAYQADQVRQNPKTWQQRASRNVNATQRIKNRQEKL